jgi:hypothetical protein
MDFSWLREPTSASIASGRGALRISSTRLWCSSLGIVTFFVLLSSPAICIPAKATRSRLMGTNRMPFFGSRCALSDRGKANIPPMGQRDRWEVRRLSLSFSNSSLFSSILLLSIFAFPFPCSLSAFRACQGTARAHSGWRQCDPGSILKAHPRLFPQPPSGRAPLPRPLQAGSRPLRRAETPRQRSAPGKLVQHAAPKDEARLAFGIQDKGAPGPQLQQLPAAEVGDTVFRPLPLQAKHGPLRRAEVARGSVLDAGKVADDAEEEAPAARGAQNDAERVDEQRNDARCLRGEVQAARRARCQLDRAPELAIRFRVAALVQDAQGTREGAEEEAEGPVCSGRDRREDLEPLDRQATVAHEGREARQGNRFRPSPISSSSLPALLLLLRDC